MVENLKHKAIKGVKWTTVKTGIVGLIGPISQIIKAKYLSPEEFGYIAVIMVFIGLLDIVENFGISQAVIQKENINKEEASSLFFLNIMLGGFLGAILFLAAPSISKFYSMPKLEYFLRWLCLIIVIGGPAHLFRAFLEKGLHFKQLSLIDITRNLIMLTAVTSFLISGYGILGVIYGYIISALFNAVLLIFISLKTNTISISFRFNLTKVYPFLKFGAFVSGKQIMTYLAHRTDEVIIGYFLEPEVLGIYYFGKNMLEKLRGLITTSFSKVLFPLFSQLKNDRLKLSYTYLKISKYIAVVSFPIFTGIAVTAHLFVPLIFGEQWNGSVIVFQVFSLTLLLLVLTANVSTSLLYSINKPDVVFYIDVITNVLYCSSLLLFVPHGMIAILAVYCGYIIGKTLFLQYYTNKQLVNSFIHYFSQIGRILFISGLMVLGVFLFQIMTFRLQSLEKFIGSVIIGVGLYTGLITVWEKETVKELRKTFLRGRVH